MGSIVHFLLQSELFLGNIMDTHIRACQLAVTVSDLVFFEDIVAYLPARAYDALNAVLLVNRLKVAEDIRQFCCCLVEAQRCYFRKLTALFVSPYASPCGVENKHGIRHFRDYFRKHTVKESQRTIVCREYVHQHTEH